MTDRIVLEVIENLHPAVVRDARKSVTPILTDLEMVPKFAKQFDLTDQNKKTTFIACMVKLYDPAYIISKKVIMRGLTPKIATIFSCTRENISFLVDTVKYYYKFDRKFREEVDLKCKHLTTIQ